MDEERPSGSAGKSFGISKWEVQRAWEKVRGDKGAPGVDEVSLDAFAVRLEGNLCKIWNRMSSGTYFPPPVMAVEIPKADGGVRMLGVPTVAGRVAQTVVAARIEAAVEPVFHPDSHGYRPRRGALDAVAACRERCWKHDWVIDLDVSRFFDSVPWDGILSAVDRHVALPWVLLYVRRWLAAPVRMPDGSLARRDRGTPQGSAVSPVLANLFMHYAFDVWMVREFPDCPFERYADDAVVHCPSEDRARQVLAALHERMGQVGLRLHPEKTKIVHCRDDNRKGPYDGPVSFDFLGFTFRARTVRSRHGVLFTGFGPAVSDKALARMGEIVRSWRLHRHVNLTWEQLARWITPVIQGWMSYYGRFHRSALYPLLGRINWHVQQWIRHKHKRLRPLKKVQGAWERVTARHPALLPHWRWVTGAWR
jgi:group II intron reverse transcriptase/maturase